ncbi:hypothetical protein G6N82_04825 [Altererythrobacter sp. BO-6]|uniref:hypothetical protein n=1 Tax=Altererythrobacter sp. BO-6 TaxID=2604537 RepID=UPI0013E160FA|nr:hypothetical protein [Altererythrobacter sp. BO-6]QIG53561.1 hypothetical protein G6N82_04825 [Altererythrobacter sp. BO-6]
MSEEAPLRPEDAPPSLYDDQGNPRFFSDPGMDRFVAVVMNLAQEVWVQEERLLALEEAKSGSHVDREAKVKEFIDRVFAPIREA